MWLFFCHNLNGQGIYLTERDGKVKEFFEIISYFPDRLKGYLLNIDNIILHKLLEIRVRRDRPINLIFTDESKFLSCVVTKDEMEYIFNSICEFSVHSFETQINEGFVTLKGGHRVGLCGIKSGGFIREITSFNFRIARCILDVSGNFCDIIYKNSLPSVLVFGAPMCGKTTFLRDVILKLADRNIKISVIDERFEFGEKLNNADVFSGYKKYEGMEIALRTMSPQIIAIDEIGSSNETKAILQCLNSGVSVLASAHGGSFEELKRRTQIRLLLDNKVFDYVVKLKGLCEVERIFEC